jgi:hypothetical protein
MVVGFFTVVIVTLVGPPRRVAWPWGMVGVAALMLIGFTVSLVASIVDDDLDGVWRWGSALTVFIVLVLVVRRRHLRATAVPSRAG